jgi:2-hydroxychromene-2-carboxylate isomerase
MRALNSQAAAQIITSPALRTLGRASRAELRRAPVARPAVRAFYEAADPYSQQCLAALPALKDRYDIDLNVHAVSAPAPDAAPELAMLKAYAIRDVQTLAAGLGWPPPGAQAAAPPADTAESRAAGDRLRRRLGHYLSAMFYFEGEWYWGLDRLAFLEERLRPFRKAGAPSAPIAPRLETRRTPAAARAAPATLEAFISFRSPYTYLAMPRTVRLAQHYGARLELRFVLPMVMRGIPAPFARCDVAETNRRELFAAGVWGVPAFRVNRGEMLWGQDRLWAIGQQLQG